MIVPTEIRASVVTGVDHVGLVVRDADAAATFYVRDLRLPVLLDEVLHERAARLVWIDAGNVLVQLVQPIGPGAVADFLETRGEGLHHVCFVVPWIDHALTAIDADTIDGIFLGGRGRRACFLRNRPAGLLVEIYEDGAGGL
jgi:catechol 2,3-dioxygenase-like lactoylglutathione lyase family enzyme